MRMMATLGAVAALSACAATPEPTSPGAGPGRCDAAAAQSLIGTHVGAVTFPADANVRIVCTTCPTTHAHPTAERLTPLIPRPPWCRTPTRRHPRHRV